MSSHKINESFQANDSKSLGLRYRSQFPKLKRFVICNNGNEEQAKDVFQEAFIITWQNIKKEAFVPKNISEFNAYLHQVAKNKWLDYVRSASYKKRAELENHHDRTEEIEDNKERVFLLVERGLKTLDDRCRDILKRFYYKKESMAEIADFFGWTEQTARNNKYRCIQQLRSEMSKLINGRNE